MGSADPDFAVREGPSQSDVEWERLDLELEIRRWAS